MPSEMLSPEAAQRFQALRERFEAGWKAGAPPSMDELLAEMPEEGLAALLTELLRIECRYRGAGCTAEECRARFPDFVPLVDTVFRELLAGSTDTHHPPPPQPPVIPSVPGYEVQERLGQGGQGVIYRARHGRLNLPVALKMLRGGIWESPEARARFAVEARAVAGLTHPHVVRVYDFGEYEGWPYFSMELVEGGSLKDRLAAGGPLPPAAAAALVETLARAVQFVHDRHIIHRDLKPANVLLAADDTPKLTDFGLAKRLDDDPGLTTSRAVLGTACYMAPEQAEGRTKEVGPAADVWALGAILYECLTGRPPFKGDSYAATVAMVVHDEPVPPRRLRPEVPEDLEAISLRCLHKEAAERYPSAAALAADLRRFLAGEPVEAVTVDVLERHARWATKLGYELVELLACGRSGYAYHARKLRIGRSVMLKINLPAGTPGVAPDRFRRQGEMMSHINHPNVVQIYDHDERGGVDYLILEHVEGGSLAGHLWRRAATDPDPGSTSFGFRHAPMPPHEAVALVEPLARAAHHLHELGIVHGAIHPGVILLTRGGTPKLSGLGTARRLDDARPLDRHAFARVAPNYLAPEQLEGRAADLGPATDVYGLGATLYELLAGEPPFLAETLQRTRDWALTRPPKPLPQTPDGVPPRLASVCERCLEKDPARRYAGAAALADDLHRILTAAAPAEWAGPSGFRLRITHASGRQQVYPLPQRRVLIGRSSESDIPLADDHVSRSHCALNWDGDLQTFVLMDFGAVNGTYVNDEAQRVVGRRELVPGDVLRVGDTRMVFEGPPPSPPAPPPG
jgi:serine/threonine protein kinase